MIYAIKCIISDYSGVKDLNEPVLLTLTERLTRYEQIIKIHGKNEQAVSKALKQLVHREHFRRDFQEYYQ